MMGGGWQGIAMVIQGAMSSSRSFSFLKGRR